MRVENFAKFTEVVLHDGLSEKFWVKTSFCFSTEIRNENKITNYFFKKQVNEKALFKTGLIKSC